MRQSGLIRCIFSLFLLLPIASFAKVNVHTYQLDNGLKLEVVVDKRSPVVISQIWYRVGSAYETPGLSGISHMLEHMMFKGSQQFPGDAMTRLVAENGGKQNAGTSRDFTYYYQALPADQLKLSFQLEADRMRNLLLKQSDFAPENKVVQEERRMRIDDNPQSLTFERFSAAAHLAAPYHHPIIGWMHDIQQLTLSDLKTWYQRWYAPNNATVIVVGDVDPKHVYQLAKTYFGKLKPNPHLPKLKSQREPPPLGERHVMVKRPAKLPYLLVGYNTPNLKTANKAWEPYALTLAAALLGGSDSARFQAQLVRKQQIAASVDANYSPYTLFPNLFVIDAIPAAGQSIEDLKIAIDEQINRLQTTRVSKAELDKVKNQAIADNIFSQDSMTNIASQLGVLASLKLPWQTINTYIDMIDAVTPKQIQQVAKLYLIKQRRTIAVLEPQDLL